MYRIKDFARLRPFSHIIWDIDGTITDETGEVSQEVAAKIINLALNNGVYHSFITGRDAEWIVQKAINPMQRFYNFSRVRDNLIFYAEVGCVVIEVEPSGEVTQRIQEEVKDHPLVTNAGGIRDLLKKLAWNPENAILHTGETKVVPPYELIYDANGQGWLIDRSQPSPPCHPYIWSTSKKAFATFEKIRDPEGKVKTFDQTPYEEIINTEIQKAGLADLIGVEVVETAINIVPKVNGAKLGKAWAAGAALLNIQEEKLGKARLLDEVIAQTVAAGDGKADLDFTEPVFPTGTDIRNKNLLLIFVGDERALPHPNAPDGKLRENIIIQATGEGDLVFNPGRDIIRLEPAKGARVISAVLDFLNAWGYFRHF